MNVSDEDLENPHVVKALFYIEAIRVLNAALVQQAPYVTDPRERAIIIRELRASTEMVRLEVAFTNSTDSEGESR